MQDSKDNNWIGSESTQADAESVTDTEGGNGAATDADGWQQYRRWISKAPAPNNRRTNVDPSLYTWKGYRNWTEQIKRNWSEKS